MQASKRFLCICSVLLGVVLVAICYSYFDNTNQSQLDGFDEDFAVLFAWSNDADDGMSAFEHKKQHGVTKIISGCDADDPGCTYHMSSDFDYSKSYWTGPAENMIPHDSGSEVYGKLPDSAESNPHSGVYPRHLAPEERTDREKAEDAAKTNVHRLEEIERQLEAEVRSAVRHPRDVHAHLTTLPFPASGRCATILQYGRASAS
jgi:hypothetical protein